MTLAQVILTPPESKKLIAMAVAEIASVKRATSHGMAVLNPSSSTYFIVEAITGAKPRPHAWVCGAIVPKGACVEAAELVEAIYSDKTKHNPATYRHSWVIRDGKLSVGIPLSELLEQMQPEDVYIKGVNAVDPEGEVGCFVGDPIGMGTIGVVLSAWRKKGFKLVFPVGLEKLIPSVRQAAEEAKKGMYSYGMGMASSLLHCPQGIVISEPKAIEILSGASAIPVAAGGIGGAEGAITLVIKGNDTQVTQAIKYVELSKGAHLPAVLTWSCDDCCERWPGLCPFPLVGKHWVTT